MPWIVLGGVMVAALALIMHAGRETTFYLDDWPIALNRRDWSVYNLMRPHVDHLQLFPTLNEKVLLEVVGMHDYWVYRLQLALLNIGTGVLLFLYGRRRIGPWPSIGLAACLVLMAPSWFNLLYAFQVNFVGAMAAGLGALLLLDRGDRRGDVWACALLVVAAGSNGVGLPFVAAAGVEVLMRPDRRARIWIPAVPAALYGLWRLIWGDEANSEVSLANVRHVPGWMMDGLDDAAAAVVGLPIEQAGAVWIGLVVLVVYGLSRADRVTPRMAGLLVLPVAYWTITGIGRAARGDVQPDESRFLYPAALMLALLAIEAAQHVRFDRRVTVAVTVALLFGAAINANVLDRRGDEFRDRSLPGKEAATALDIAGHLAPYDFGTADLTQRGPSLIVAGPYLQAVADYGSSPGYTREELVRADPRRKLGVDQALVRVHAIAVVPAALDAPTGGEPPAVREAEGGTAAPAEGGCVHFEPTADPGTVAVDVPWEGIVVRATEEAAEVRLRRFGTLWPPAALGTAEPQSARFLRPAAPDKAPEPFVAQVRSSAPVEVCAAR